MILKVKKMKPGAHMPAQATPGAAGYDLRACCDEKGITLQPMERAVIPTGLSIELPGPEYMALVFARSGRALHAGLALANGVGVIDSDYRGEVGVVAVNLSQMPIHITDGERVAQLVVVPVALPDMLEVQEELSSTGRGEGGFGSTGTE